MILPDEQVIDHGLFVCSLQTVLLNRIPSGHLRHPAASTQDPVCWIAQPTSSQAAIPLDRNESRRASRRQPRSCQRASEARPACPAASGSPSPESRKQSAVPQAASSHAPRAQGPIPPHSKRSAISSPEHPLTKFFLNSFLNSMRALDGYRKG